MRKMSKQAMDSIVEYFDQYFCEKHTTPSINEIAMGIGIPKTTAFRYLVEMDKREILEYDGKSRTIVTEMISKFATDYSSVPRYDGPIPCGTAEEKEAHVREYINLPVSLFGSGQFYIL